MHEKSKEKRKTAETDGASSHGFLYVCVWIGNEQINKQSSLTRKKNRRNYAIKSCFILLIEMHA